VAKPGSGYQTVGVCGGWPLRVGGMMYCVAFCFLLLDSTFCCLILHSASRVLRVAFCLVWFDWDCDGTHFGWDTE